MAHRPSLVLLISLIAVLAAPAGATPAAPTITEPLTDGRVLNPADLHMRRLSTGLAYVPAPRDDTYMSKLTLSVDDDVIRRAKRYAAKRATSVSQLVEWYLDLLSGRPQKDGKQDPPVLRMLRGAARGVKVEDYRRHVLQKYR